MNKLNPFNWFKKPAPEPEPQYTTVSVESLVEVFDVYDNCLVVLKLPIGNIPKEKAEGYCASIVKMLKPLLDKKAENVDLLVFPVRGDIPLRIEISDK